MSAEWYYSIDGVVRGPFDARTIRSMAERGELKPTDLLRRAKDGEWVAAGNTKGLVFGSLAPPPIPVPVWGYSPPAEASVPPPVPVPAWGYPPSTGVPVPPPRYVYKMVQMPPNVEVQEGTSTEGRAAAYLEGVVNEYAREGWEFFRVDQVGIRINPGCLAGFFGAHANTFIYYVVTFRKPV